MEGASHGRPFFEDDVASISASKSPHEQRPCQQRLDRHSPPPPKVSLRWALFVSFGSLGGGGLQAAFDEEQQQAKATLPTRVLYFDGPRDPTEMVRPRPFPLW
jgi:hypothetical protein